MAVKIILCASISGKAWEDFCDALKEAGQQVLGHSAPSTESLDRAEALALSLACCALAWRAAGIRHEHGFSGLLCPVAHHRQDRGG